MEYVSHELMEATWQQVGAQPLKATARMQKRHQKAHKVLTRFAYDNLFVMREDAAGVGIYVFHVILEAFSRGAPRPGKIRPPAIERARALSDDELARESRRCEPHVAQYLEDALSNSEQDEEVLLTPQEWAECARVLRAALLCLHRACARADRSRGQGASAGDAGPVGAPTSPSPPADMAMDEEGSEAARAALFQAIDQQVANGDPPETAETLNRLLEAGHSRDEAYRLIGCALGDEMFHVMKEEREYDAARYVRLLQALPDMPWE